MDVPIKLQEYALADCQYLVDQVASRCDKSNALPRVKVIFLQTDDSVVSIRPVIKNDPKSDCHIQISVGYLKAILSTIVSAGTFPIASLGASVEHHDFPINVVEEEIFVHWWRHSVRFTVAHELAHLISGHMGYWRNLPTGEKSPNDYILLRELDADGTAVRLCTGYLYSVDPIRIVALGLGVRTEVPTLMEKLKGPHRVLAYRMALLAAWASIAAIDNLAEDQGQVDSQYPLPATRFLNTVLICRLSYFRLTPTVDETGCAGLHFDSADQMVQQIKQMGFFIKNIVEPLMTAGDALDDELPLRRLLRLSRETNSPKLQMADIKRLMLGIIQESETQSCLARELLTSKKIRLQMDADLSPYRYWKEATLAW